MTDSLNASPHRVEDYTKSLAIVYQDRAEHLRYFIPHRDAYFERDKLDC